MKVKRVIFFALFQILIIMGNRNNLFAKFDVSIKNLKTHVENLINTPTPRNFANVPSLDSAARYIKLQFEDMGYSANEQVYEVDGEKYRNIIVLIGPEDTKRIVIGAHYDVCGDQDGADDNASAVAGLLELARIAKENENYLSKQIEFVAYTLEEPPYFASKNMGSFVHARSLKSKKIDIEVMICLEMIGYFTEEKGQKYPLPLMKLFYPSQGNFIAVVGNFNSKHYIKKMRDTIRKNSSIDCHSLTAPSILPGIDWSDHRNYWHFGYKAIMITDTSFYRNKYYHTPNDTIEKLDFEKMAQVVKGIAHFFIKK